MGTRIAHATLAATILLAVAASQALAETTVKQILRDYDQATPERRQTLQVALGNVAVGMGWSNSYLQQVRKQSPLYCEPNTFNSNDVIDMLRRTAQADPKISDIPYGFGILITMQRNYPCPNNGGNNPGPRPNSR
jgi:hypothetical protein